MKKFSIAATSPGYIIVEAETAGQAVELAAAGEGEWESSEDWWEIVEPVLIVEIQ